MLEVTANGAGQAAEDAAGREDQRAVGELGFGAGGRAAEPGVVPDPELVERAKRRGSRRSTSWRILREGRGVHEARRGRRAAAP